METKIKEVADYFKGKILVGEYEVIKFDFSYLEILIDKYVFWIWISGGMTGFRIWPYSGFIEFTNEEKEIGFSVATKFISKNKAKINLEQIEKLKAELLELETTI